MRLKRSRQVDEVYDQMEAEERQQAALAALADPVAS
jgi:hypothetical protein